MAAPFRLGGSLGPDARLGPGAAPGPAARPRGAPFGNPPDRPRPSGPPIRMPANFIFGCRSPAAPARSGSCRLADRPDFVLLVQRCPELAPEKERSGIRLSVATGLRRNPAEALNPAWKTGNYLNNLLCLREARSRGADEVVILNLAGEVTEAAVSNVAFVRSGSFATPPLSSGILGGITLELGSSTGSRSAAGLEVREETLRPSDFGGMEECFLLSTTKDIVPVAAIDGAGFRVGPGTATARLKRGVRRGGRGLRVRPSRAQARRSRLPTPMRCLGLDYGTRRSDSPTATSSASPPPCRP